MKIHHLFIPFFAALLIVSCNRDQVTVTDFEPQGEVQDLQSFTITFDQDLAPSEAQDKWLTEAFVSFKPEIPGRFKWLNAYTLLFSPEGPLPESQDFTATINQDVLFDKKLKLQSSTYSFHTPLLLGHRGRYLLGANPPYRPSRARDGQPAVQL